VNNAFTTKLFICRLKGKTVLKSIRKCLKSFSHPSTSVFAPATTTKVKDLFFLGRLCTNSTKVFISSEDLQRKLKNFNNYFDFLHLFSFSHSSQQTLSPAFTLDFPQLLLLIG